MRRRLKIEMYKDRRGQWRWRMLARNGKVIADSAESYSKRGNVVRAARSVRQSLANIVDIKDGDQS